MRKTNKGFTLMELLMAATILAFAISGLLSLFVNCALLNEASRNLSIATSHSQFVMEGIKNASFTTLKTNIDNGDWDLNSAEINSSGLSALPNESINTQVSGTELLDVAVVVTWQDRTQRNRILTLETLIGES